MGDMVIRVEGYKTVMHIHYTAEGVMHIHYTAEGHYVVTEGAHILNIGGTTYKEVLRRTRVAIKRRG